MDLTTGVAPLRLNVSFPGPNSVRDVVQAQVAPVITSQEPIIGFEQNASRREPDCGQYKMSKGIGTITDLWREWKYGLTGSPSTESLERRNGPAWCATKADRRFFNRRKLVIDSIESKARQMSGELSETASFVAQQFEQQRASLGKSIDWITKNLPEFLNYFNF